MAQLQWLYPQMSRLLYQYWRKTFDCIALRSHKARRSLETALHTHRIKGPTIKVLHSHVTGLVRHSSEGLSRDPFKSEKLINLYYKDLFENNNNSMETKPTQKRTINKTMVSCPNKCKLLLTEII